MAFTLQGLHEMTTNTEGSTQVPIKSFSLFFTSPSHYSMHCIERLFKLFLL